jgi:phosphate transport system substrate-binding protein
MKLRLIATALAANLVAITAAIALDANLPAYQAVSGISGQIKSVGSDTLNNEMELWAKGFEAQYPGVNIEIEGKGSATAPPALRPHRLSSDVTMAISPPTSVSRSMR